MNKQELSGQIDEDKALLAENTSHQLRQAFLTLHIDWLVGQLVQLCQSGEHMAVSEVAFQVAAWVPGLVPDADQLQQDNQLAQQQKQGLEGWQGLLLGALFAHPEGGRLLLDLFRRPTNKALQLKAQFERDGKLELDKVSLVKQGDAGHISFENPECINAEDNQLITDFETALDLVLLCDNIKVGVLRGGKVSHPKYRGKRVFSAGINLKHISSGDISFCDFILGREVGYIHKMIRGLNLDANPEHEKPWVAAVDTFAIGGGMQLLLASDYVIACQDSYASLPAAKEGIVPGVANLRLPRMATGRLAQQVILQGKRLFASDPQSAILFDAVFTPEQMDGAVSEGAAQMAAPAVVSNRKMLRISQEPQSLLQAYMADFALEQIKRLYSEDVVAKVGRFSA